MNTTTAATNVARGLTLYITVQFMSRCLTFILNQYSLRKIAPEHLGIATLQLELLLLLALAWTRQGFRSAILRSSSASKKDDGELFSNDGLHLVQDVALVSVAFGAILSTIIVFGFSVFASNETRASPFFDLNVLLYFLAIIIELLCEPYYYFCETRMMFDAKAKAEGVRNFSSSLTFFFVVCFGHFFQKELGALPFSTAQFVSSIFYTLYFRYCAISLAKKEYLPLNLFKLRPGNIRITKKFRQTCKLAMTLNSQVFLKELLAQADKISVGVYATNLQQGQYALISNYGSLLCRVLFFPIEDIGRNLFSHMFIESNESDASSMLSMIMKFYFVLSLVIIPFGIPYADLGLKLFVSQSFRNHEMVTLLQLYLIYLSCLSFNGILEAFVSSCIKASHVHNQSFLIVICSLLYILGVRSTNYWNISPMILLIFTNIIAMIVRAAWCISYSKSQNLITSSNLAIYPKPRIVLYTAFCFFTLMFMRSLYLNDQLAPSKFIGSGILLGIGYLGLLYRYEFRFFKALARSIQ